jgi:hypothetical protein
MVMFRGVGHTAKVGQHGNCRFSRSDDTFIHWQSRSWMYCHLPYTRASSSPRTDPNGQKQTVWVADLDRPAGNALTSVLGHLQ